MKYSFPLHQSLEGNDKPMDTHLANIFSATPANLVGNQAPVQRARLNTADTPVMRNAPEVIETSPRDILDDCSLVSSLSKDDSQLGDVVEPNTELVGAKISMPTPQELVLENTGDPSVPAWLKDCAVPAPPRLQAPLTALPEMARRATSLQTQVPRVQTAVSASPHIPRPTFGRNQSCPATMDFSIANSSRASNRLQPLKESTASTSTPLSAIKVNGRLLTDISYREGMTDPFVNHNKHNAHLLGQRPRRHVRTRSAASASLGSTMSLTAPTTTSTTITSATTSSTFAAQQKLSAYTGAQDGMACCRSHHEAAYRKKKNNVVKQELQYAFNRMSSPIRNMGVKKQETANLKLKRSKGCLT